MRTHDNRNDLSRSTIFFFKVLAVIFGGVRIVVPGEPGRELTRLLSCYENLF